MGLFDTEDKIDYNWLIDNGFRVRKGYRADDSFALTKILRTRDPFVYISFDITTFLVVLHWVDIGKGTGITGNAQALYMGVITDRIQMSSIIHKYSQENFSIN